MDKANESAAMQEAKSEWTTCSAEIATTVDPSAMDYLIVHDGYAFVVLDGNFDVNPVEKDVTADPESVTYEKKTYNTDGEVLGFAKDGTVVKKAPAEGGETVTADGYDFSDGYTVYALTIA